MSEDKLNAEANNNLDKDDELITDSPSSPLEKKDGPKRRKKKPRKKAEETVAEEVVEEVVEEVIEEVVEEPAEIKGIPQGIPQGSPKIAEDGKKKKKKKSKKAARKSTNKTVVVEEVEKIDTTKIEEHVVADGNEESKAPKTMKDRYIKIVNGKSFEVRLKGKMIFNSPIGNTDFELDDRGITINNKHYKYSEVVIRIKR